MEIIIITITAIIITTVKLLWDVWSFQNPTYYIKHCLLINNKVVKQNKNTHLFINKYYHFIIITNNNDCGNYGISMK